jgi:hypothetical protein
MGASTSHNPTCYRDSFTFLLLKQLAKYLVTLQRQEFDSCLLLQFQQKMFHLSSIINYFIEYLCNLILFLSQTETKVHLTGLYCCHLTGFLITTYDP